MRHSLFFYLLAVMAFLLTACSMQSPEADRSAVDASTESVSNNPAQSGASKEPDELPAKEDENKVENPGTDARESVPDGTESPISTDVPSAETQPEKPEPSTETDVPVEEEPAQMPTLMLSIDGTPVPTYISSATKRGSSTFVCTPCDIPTPQERLNAVYSPRCCKSCLVTQV